MQAGLKNSAKLTEPLDYKGLAHRHHNQKQLEDKKGGQRQYGKECHLNSLPVV
jgi:hypothetical protein